MEETKVLLSEEELQLMHNSGWILTKNGIIEKVSRGFAQLVVEMQHHIASCQPMLDDSVMLTVPKISRGEKYKGLPYIILDYPRLFGKENTLAIRTLFWWGNYCSITLHAKGHWQEIVLKKMNDHYQQLQAKGFYLSFSGDEWNHNIFDANYFMLRQFSREEVVLKLPTCEFVKLAAKVEIGPWIDMEKRLFNLFLFLIELIRH